MPPCGDVPLSAFGSVDKLCLDAVCLLFADVSCDRRGDRLAALDEYLSITSNIANGYCLAGNDLCIPTVGEKFIISLASWLLSRTKMALALNVPHCFKYAAQLSGPQEPADILSI